MPKAFARHPLPQGERVEKKKRTDMGNGLFEGLKVIDCASFIAAPLAATVLSDFGADVIKIEPPGEGDAYRSLATRPGAAPANMNYGWVMGARNKRSIALDLKSSDGVAILNR